MERKRVARNSSRNGVVVGSVWETRMKGCGEIEMGWQEIHQESEKSTEKNHPTEIDKVSLRSKQSSNGVDGGLGKRKTWNSEGNEKIPVIIPKARSENKKVLNELSKELSVSNSMDGNEIKKTPIQIKKWNKSVSIDGNERNTVHRIIKTRSLSRKESPSNDLSDGIEKAKGIEVKNGSDSCQSLEELDDVCEEKLMTDDLGKVKTLDSEDHEEDEEACNGATMVENEEKAIVVVKEMEPISIINKKKSPDVNHPEIISKSNEFSSQRLPKSPNKLQTFIDLIMWRDASKSALIFGLGTFYILSSSYTKDLNISFISVISYLGLIYLAVIFIFRSFIFRGGVETDNITDEEEYVIGEDEAIWALNFFLPYINEILLKIKALFSGDPATTMKLAVLLFVLARCGSSITIWKMAKLAFFGGFTVPKICSSYSSQLTAYGKFWVRQFKDAWQSCSQKKVVALGVFALVWNLSSMVSRIWGGFILLVAFKYYQQSMMKDKVVEEEEPMTRVNQTRQEQKTRENLCVNQMRETKKKNSVLLKNVVS